MQAWRSIPTGGDSAFGVVQHCAAPERDDSPAGIGAYPCPHAHQAVGTESVMLAHHHIVQPGTSQLSIGGSWDGKLQATHAAPSCFSGVEARLAQALASIDDSQHRAQVSACASLPPVSHGAAVSQSLHLDGGRCTAQRPLHTAADAQGPSRAAAHHPQPAQSLTPEPIRLGRQHLRASAAADTARPGSAPPAHLLQSRCHVGELPCHKRGQIRHSHDVLRCAAAEEGSAAAHRASPLRRSAQALARLSQALQEHGLQSKAQWQQQYDARNSVDLGTGLEATLGLHSCAAQHQSSESRRSEISLSPEALPQQCVSVRGQGPSMHEQQEVAEAAQVAEQPAWRLGGVPSDWSEVEARVQRLLGACM